MSATKEINLQMLTDEKFAALCHALLSEEHGISYKPVAGEGGDSGIDGFVNDYEVVYQFKFFRSRPRPASFVKDINKIAHLSNLKRWVLLIPEDPTQKLYQLIEKEKASRPFAVNVLGKTWLLSKLDKFKHIKERFFSEIAKEVSVQKVISLSEQKAQKHEKMLTEIKNEIISKKPNKIIVERPADILSQEHVRDVLDEIKRIGKVSNGKYSYAAILRQLKNKYRVSNWHLIKDCNYGEIMTWLNSYYHGVKELYPSPSQIRKRLQGVIKSQQKMLGLSDRKYRESLFQITGKTSSTIMEICELERVKDEFNILLGSK
ncbi:MAG TPA: hypothetical protein ACFYD7_07925 [Candidatus Wujingus californicus]|uniref:hypothetical protein n=1 Tax=Candidatus Wujingus californicus TaxID=3367618 RepID=UPI001D9E138C|nr:hypothetical protein [Planctomycetota bacterium]